MVRILTWAVFALFVAKCSMEETEEERSKRDHAIWAINSVPQNSDADKVIEHFGPLFHQWGDDSISSSTRHSTTRALKIFYQKGSYVRVHDHRGAGFFSKPNAIPQNVDAMILSYDVYFENFGWNKGGKLPGLYGGEDGEGAYKCSGGSNPSTCFSLRLMWREHGAGEIYAYIPKNQESGFEQRPDVVYNPVYGQSLGRGKTHWMNNKWHSVTEEVHLNTVGKANGWVKMCIKAEGHSQQCYTANHLVMRNNHNIHLRGMMFSTFFGGGDPSWAAPNDCSTYYKNFKISVPDHAVVG